MIAFDPSPWKAPAMKTVTEQEKASSLLSLTEEDVGEFAYKFVQGTVKRYHNGNMLHVMSDRQTTWFHDLYDKHFGG